MNGDSQAVRSVKGILNKLTPEKFDRLLRQLLEVIVSAEVLKATIGLVFENAVAQPTFCAMYAELCLCLAGELPAFPPPVGEDKPLAFKRVLLNTCQDEFEGAAAAREVRALAAHSKARCTLCSQHTAQRVCIVGMTAPPPPPPATCTTYDTSDLYSPQPAM